MNANSGYRAYVNASLTSNINLCNRYPSVGPVVAVQKPLLLFVLAGKNKAAH